MALEAADGQRRVEQEPAVAPVLVGPVTTSWCLRRSDRRPGCSLFLQPAIFVATSGSATESVPTFRIGEATAHRKGRARFKKCRASKTSTSQSGAIGSDRAWKVFGKRLASSSAWTQTDEGLEPYTGGLRGLERRHADRDVDRLGSCLQARRCLHRSADHSSMGRTLVCDKVEDRGDLVPVPNQRAARGVGWGMAGSRLRHGLLRSVPPPRSAEEDCFFSSVRLVLLPGARWVCRRDMNPSTRPTSSLGIWPHGA